MVVTLWRTRDPGCQYKQRGVKFDASMAFMAQERYGADSVQVILPKFGLQKDGRSTCKHAYDSPRHPQA